MTSEIPSFVELSVSPTSGKKMGSYSQEERKTHCEEWRQSGLSMSEYCRRCNFTISTFCKWAKKLSNQSSSDVKKRAEKLSLHSTRHTLVELVLTNGIRLRFGEISHISDMVRLVKALESCS